MEGKFQKWKQLDEGVELPALSLKTSKTRLNGVYDCDGGSISETPSLLQKLASSSTARKLDISNAAAKIRLQLVSAKPAAVTLRLSVAPSVRYLMLVMNRWLSVVFNLVGIISGRVAHFIRHFDGIVL